VGSFKAAWEVDRFVLPKTCDRALAQLHDRLKLATHELLEVCVPSRPVISICSWLPGEGRTTLGILLAKALANGGQRVLLVDADWQNPGLASQVGVDPQDGWCPEKATLGELADCCVYSLEDQFTILPLTERNRGMETESRHAWLTSIEQLSSHFQYVLLDHRPGVVVANQTISDHLGLWLLVRDLRRTSDESLDQFAKQMESQVPAPIRIVENFAHLGQEMEQVA
jgi:Mrp family chromosome partitioning ATPase